MDKCCNKCKETKSIEVFPSKGAVCKACIAIRSKKYREDPINKKASRDRCKKWIENNKERSVEVWKAYYEKNKHKYSAKAYAYMEKYPDRQRQYIDKWQSNNKSKLTYYASTRRSRKLEATVDWGNTEFIQQIYSLTKILSENTGTVWNVDHIVPLKSKIVCGLHCEANLQIIPSKQNKSKGNRHWPDMWSD